MAVAADLDWNDLRFFLNAARAGSLSGAARILGVTHSTIGRRLDALERALGGTLLVRSPDGLRLAPLGEKVLPFAEAVEQAALGVAALAETLGTRVRLAVPSGFSRLFAARLGGFHRRHPEIVLDLLSGSKRLDLKAGEAEIALRVGPLSDPDLVSRKVGTSGWSLYGARSYLARRAAPADPRNLDGHDLLGFEASLERSPGAQWLQVHGARANIVLRTREISEMLAAAVSGAGLAVLPCMLGDSEPALERLTPEVLGSHTVSLVYRKESMLSPAVRSVRQFAIGVVAEHAKALSGKP